MRHPRTVAALLPYLYGVILLAEALGLTVLYVLDPPAASDPISVVFGWIGLLSMIVMLVYSLARRSKLLRRVARLSVWLHFHIFLGVQGVLFAFFHAMPLFGRLTEVIWVNPGVLNLAAMLVIFGSGLFGRYLYSWVPHTLGGEQMAIKDVEAELAAAGAVPPEVAALWKDAPAAGGFFRLVSADLATRRAVRRLRGMSLSPDVKRLAERRVLLERRRAALATAQRAFRNWIFLHRPLAAALYVLSIVHVLLAYMFSPALR